LDFLSGYLFSADIHNVYDAVRTPVWVSHGCRGDFVDYRQLPQFAERNHWRVSVFDGGALPYFEQAHEFLEAYQKFLNQPAT
jgi:hypothetical protein